MYAYKTLKIYDLLAKKPLYLDGLVLDAEVMVTVTQKGSFEPEVEIEYIKDLCVLSDNNSLPLNADVLTASAPLFYDEMAKMIENEALRQAEETPGYKWDHVENDEL